MPINPNPVNWFEIPVSDMARAKTFYEAVFQAELAETEMGPNKMAWFPMEMGRYGAAGNLIQGEGYTPSQEGTLIYINVPKIDAALASIDEAGGKILRPRISIGDHGFIAHFLDTEGNRVALHENPEQS